MKLTKPQLELLTNAVADGRATCADSYAPKLWLLRLGYVSSHRGKYSDWIEPTESGRRALRSALEQSKEK